MDQQFRLKWNNHCNTLLQVFGNLLKTETLVDCTIGADGQYLKAHKVVVSACSPYFQSLFTEHFDKHPIIILKDIKFTELQSMIDYMYEGEVNISQDQLPSFLKAAASIQLKGLTQNTKSDHNPMLEPPQHHQNMNKLMPPLNTARNPGVLSNGQMPSSMLNVELDEGHQQRKKRKLEGGPPSSTSSSPSLVPDLVVPNVILDVPSENNGNNGGGMNNSGAAMNNGPSNQNNGENLKKEPSEYSGRSDEEEEDNMSQDGWDHSNDGIQDNTSNISAGERGFNASNPGGNGGNRTAGLPLSGNLSGQDLSNVDENNQGKLQNYVDTLKQQQQHPLPAVLQNSLNLQMIGRKILPKQDFQQQEEMELNTKENTNCTTEEFKCKNCGRTYTRKGNLGRHLKYECQKVPQFSCSSCTKKFYRKEKLQYHMNTTHSHLKDFNSPLNLNTSVNLNITASHLAESIPEDCPINLSTNNLHMNGISSFMPNRYISTPPNSLSMSPLGQHLYYY